MYLGPPQRKSVMITRKFWPLDFDPEGEIYENVAWDLPGLRPRRNPKASRPGTRDLQIRIRRPDSTK